MPGLIPFLPWLFLESIPGEPAMELFCIGVGRLLKYFESLSTPTSNTFFKIFLNDRFRNFHCYTWCSTT
jgi:hypothetical protein